MTRSEFNYALSKGETEQIERRLILKKTSRLDDFGYKGKITISLDGKEIGSVPIYDQKATESLAVEQQKGSWIDSFRLIMRKLLVEV
ncbi:hypothetical protein D3C76_1420670 [compost metagenome]